MKASEEVSGGFLVARGDAAKVFDVVEEPLDEIAFCIKRIVAVALNLAVRLWWNHNRDAAPFQAVNKAVRIIPLVGQQGLRRNVGGEPLSLRDVVNLTLGERHLQWIAESVCHDMDFCRQPTARTAYGLIATVFFCAPALC